MKQRFPSIHPAKRAAQEDDGDQKGGLGEKASESDLGGGDFLRRQLGEDIDERAEKREADEQENALRDRP